MKMPRERYCTRSAGQGRTPGCRSSALKQSWRRCRLMLTMTGCASIMLWQPIMTTWVTIAVPSTTASKNYCYVAASKAPTTPTP